MCVLFVLQSSGFYFISHRNFIEVFGVRWRLRSIDVVVLCKLFGRALSKINWVTVVVDLQNGLCPHHNSLDNIHPFASWVSDTLSTFAAATTTKSFWSSPTSTTSPRHAHPCVIGTDKFFFLLGFSLSIRTRPAIATVFVVRLYTSPRYHPPSPRYLSGGTYRAKMSSRLCGTPLCRRANTTTRHFRQKISWRQMPVTFYSQFEKWKKISQASSSSTWAMRVMNMMCWRWWRWC